MILDGRRAVDPSRAGRREWRSGQPPGLAQDIESYAGSWRAAQSHGILPGMQANTIVWILSARRYGSILTRKRDPGPREGIAKEVGVRAGAAGVTPPEARYSQPRLELR